MKENIVDWWHRRRTKTISRGRIQREEMKIKTLSGLCKAKNFGSDKGTTHSYIDGYYTHEFTPLRYEKLNIVEIGVYFGCSLLMWKSWFRNAEITGVDNKLLGHNGREYNGIIKIKGDAYSDDIVNNFDDNSIDYLIDDGPHTLASQLTCVQKYFSKIKLGGKIIIEDVQDCEKASLEFQKLDVIKNSLCTFEVIDLRHIKNRLDDVLFILKKV